MVLLVESHSADCLWRLNSEDMAAGAKEKLAPTVNMCQDASETSALKKQLSKAIKSRRVLQIVAQPYGFHQLTGKYNV